MKILRVPLTFLGLLGLMIVLIVSASGCAQGGFAVLSSDQALLQAAKTEIEESNANHNKETACSIYVRNVLIRAGYPVPSFTANDFDEIMAKYLSGWKMREFTTSDLEGSRAELREFLNSFPDHTALLAQWPRDGESGHVAILEKAAGDHFVIYQAQQGKAVPHTNDTSVQSLLYSKNDYGERSHLRVFYDPQGH